MAIKSNVPMTSGGSRILKGGFRCPERFRLRSCVYTRPATHAHKTTKPPWVRHCMYLYEFVNDQFCECCTAITDNGKSCSYDHSLHRSIIHPLTSMFVDLESSTLSGTTVSVRYCWGDNALCSFSCFRMWNAV